MKIELVLVLAVLILTGECLAGSNSIKTNVGTITLTNVLFKQPDWDKGIGGGYAISTNAEGEDHTVLNFASEAKFEVFDDRTITIDMGSKTLTSGATTFGMTAAVSQKYYTPNGYRSSEFSTSSRTILPYQFDIANTAYGLLSGGKANGKNSNTVTIGDKVYNFESTGNNDGGLSSNSVYDPTLESLPGFGWENEFGFKDRVDECGLDYIGEIQTGSLIAI
jgi:hypothetical protein